MMILRVLAALALVAGTWWSMAEVVWSSDYFRSGISETIELTRTGPRELADLPLIEDHRFSDCCVDLGRGRAFALFTVLLGGFPMAGLALMIRYLRRGRAIRPALAPILLAAFIFQFAAMVIASVLVLVLAAFIGDILDEPGRQALVFFAYLVLTAVVSAFALPAWHGLRMNVAAVPVPSPKSL